MLSEVEVETVPMQCFHFKRFTLSGSGLPVLNTHVSV